MRFSFTHSHAFPGGLVIVERGTDSEATCVVEFGDGIAVEAECEREGEDFVLSIPSYRTAKGTPIGPHRWRIARRDDGSWRSAPESP